MHFHLLKDEAWYISKGEFIYKWIDTEEATEQETIVREGVKIIGASNLPCSIPNHASSLYSRNLLSLLQPMFKEGKFLIDNDDELIAGSLISKDGVILKSEIIENGGTRS